MQKRLSTNKPRHKFTWQISCLVISVLALLIGTINFYQGNQAKQQSQQQQTTQKKLRTQQQLTKFQRHRPLYSETEQAVDQFMTGYLTFDNQKMYDARRQAVKKVISPAVYQDRQVFKIDKYHKVKQLSLQGTYVDSLIVPIKLQGQQMTATVFATQKLNFENETGKNTQKVFTLTYDGQTHQITQVKEDGTFHLNVDSNQF